MHHHVRPANRVVTVAPGRAPAATTAIDQQKAHHRVPRSGNCELRVSDTPDPVRQRAGSGQVWAITFYGASQPPCHREAWPALCYCAVHAALYSLFVVELSHGGPRAVPLTVVTGPVGGKRVSLGLSAAEWVILQCNRLL